MADTQNAPQQQPAGLRPTPALGGSIDEAQEALLSLLDPIEETPEIEEEKPAEEEESTGETQDESLEEEQPDEDGEEAEGEEPDEDEETDEDEEAEESDEVTLYTVKVNGEDTEVSEDELIRGYSRHSDYTKKTQELAEERRNIETTQSQYYSELSALQQERQQYAEALTQVIQSSMAGLEQYSNIDWETLKTDDPIEYITKRDEYREIQERVRQNQYQAQQIQQQQEAEMQQVKKNVLQEEHG
jgi:hypothetical protein